MAHLIRLAASDISIVARVAVSGRPLQSGCGEKCGSPLRIVKHPPRGEGRAQVGSGPNCEELSASISFPDRPRTAAIRVMATPKYIVACISYLSRKVCFCTELGSPSPFVGDAPCSPCFSYGWVIDRQAHNLKVRGSNPLPATNIHRMIATSGRRFPHWNWRPNGGAPISREPAPRCRASSRFHPK